MSKENTENKFKVGDLIYSPKLVAKAIKESRTPRFYKIIKITPEYYRYDIFEKGGKLVKSNFKYKSCYIEKECAYYRIRNSKLARKVYKNYKVIDENWLEVV